MTEARLLDPRQSVGEGRGKGVHHVFQQNDPRTGEEILFDQRGRECSPNGKLLDPTQVGLEHYEIMNQPAPPAAVKDVSELTRLVGRQQDQIEKMTALLEKQLDVPVPHQVPVEKQPEEMSLTELRTLADESGLTYTKTHNSAALVKIIREAA